MTHKDRSSIIAAHCSKYFDLLGVDPMLSLLIYCLTGLISGCAGDRNGYIQSDSTVAVAFHGGYGSIEVGGPYAGFESHHSRPLPSRISFFAPVANSMDLSTD